MAEAANPFCSRNVRPGAVPFVFPPDLDAETLARRLESQRWWGEIVGPHGSGKSTLLHALATPIRRRGRELVWIELHDGQRRLPVRLRTLEPRDTPRVIAVDGYEQLGRFSRFVLKRTCRRRGWGLLVTSHVSVGLPALYTTEVSLELAARLVEELLGGRHPAITQEVVREAYRRQDGNLREVLFDLYDVWEAAAERGP